MRPLRTTPACALALALASAAPVFAQANSAADPDLAGPARSPARDTEAPVTRGELEGIAAELDRLRTEVAALRLELALARAAGPNRAPLTMPAAIAAQPPPALSMQPERAEPGVEMLRAQVEELAQTRVETQSKMPVRLFGAIVSNTVFNTGMANWLENPNIVDAETAGVEPGSFTSTLRQSQIGLNVGPIPFAGVVASGTVVADFMGGVPGFVTGTVMGLPRMVYAFGRIESERTALQVGQDHDLLAPRDPTSIAAQTFPLLFRAGNLYLRSPQVRLEQKLGGVTLKGGIAAPIAADFPNVYTFAPPAGQGERSSRPAFETRVDYTAGTPAADGEFTLGASGRYGWRRPGESLESAASWALDFNARWGRLGAAGEYFYTDDAAEFGAAVAQARPARGGWVEARVALTRQLSANVGAGLDRVRESVPAGARRENKSAFGNVIFDLTPEVALSMEYRWLETALGRALSSRENHHVNATFVVRF